MIEFLHLHLTPERLGWFGAGVSAAALGVTAYQLVFAPAPLSPVPPPVLAQPPTSATRTAFPTRTPYPSRTPYPTRRPTPTAQAPDLLGTALAADPDRLVFAVATVSARTSDVLASLQATRPSR